MGFNVFGRDFSDIIEDKFKDCHKIKIKFPQISPELKEAANKLAEKNNLNADKFELSK